MMVRNLLVRIYDWKNNVKKKKVNGNLNSNISAANADRPIVSCPENQYDLRANKTTPRNKSNNGNSYPQVEEHRLHDQKYVILGHLNVNSLRNKIETVEGLMENNIDIPLFSENKLDDTFWNLQFKMRGY